MQEGFTGWPFRFFQRTVQHKSGLHGHTFRGALVDRPLVVPGRSQCSGSDRRMPAFTDSPELFQSNRYGSHALPKNKSENSMNSSRCAPPIEDLTCRFPPRSR